MSVNEYVMRGWWNTRRQVAMAPSVFQSNYFCLCLFCVY